MTATPITHSTIHPFDPRVAGRRLLVAAASLVLVAVAACGSGSADTGASADEAGPARAAASPSTGGGAGSEIAAPALVARPEGAVDVFAAPGDATPTTTLPSTTSFGSPRALLVVDQQDGWIEVALPVRPNGSTGWVRSGGVEMREVDHQIVVDVADRSLTLRAGGEDVLTTPVAIGTDEHPTPVGEFYVVDKLATGGDGAYGPYALGLSAHSDVLTEFAGGDGQVGIHGTDDPGSIGRAVSHGCIRVPNDVIAELNDVVSLGTPVTVA